MNQKFKSGKKVLSLVLSVLMLMSCLVFAPVANAAEDETTVKVVYHCTDGFPLKDYEKGDYVLTIYFEDGSSHAIDILYDYGDEGHRARGARKFASGQTIVEDRTTTYSFTATSKVKSAYMAQNVYGWKNNELGYKITVYQNDQQVADEFSYLRMVGSSAISIGTARNKYNDYIFGETSRLLFPARLPLLRSSL